MDLRLWKKFEYRPGNRPVAYRADGPNVLDASGVVVSTEASPQGAALKTVALNVKYPAKDERPVISMEIKRPKRAEARDFQAKFSPLLKALLKSGQPHASIDDKVNAANDVITSIDENALHEVFEKWVRNVGGLTIDGESLTTGLDLLDVADNNVVYFVVNAIFGLMVLKEEEAKTSASPSTSSAGAGLIVGTDSVVMSTVNVSGTGLSTATETQPAPEPSGAPAP